MHWGSIEDGNISSLSIFCMYLVVEHVDMHKSLVYHCDTIFNDVSVGKNMEYFSTSIIHDSVSTIKISGKKNLESLCSTKQMARFHRSLCTCDWEFISSHIQFNSYVLLPYILYIWPS